MFSQLFTRKEKICIIIIKCTYITIYTYPLKFCTRILSCTTPIHFWNELLILSARWTQTEREREVENTPEGRGISLRGSTAVVRETAPSCLWIRIFIHGTLILLQRHSLHVSSLKRKHVSRLSMHTAFLDRWMRHIFFKNIQKTCLIFQVYFFSHCQLYTYDRESLHRNMKC